MIPHPERCSTGIHKPNEKCLSSIHQSKFPRFHQVDSEKRLLDNAKDLTQRAALRRCKDKKKSNTMDKTISEKCNYRVIIVCSTDCIDKKIVNYSF